MSSTSPYSKDPFHKFVDCVFSKIQKYKMELFFVTVAILLFAGCRNSIMNTLQKHIVGTLFKEIASYDILLRGGAVVFLLLCLVVFSRHIYHRYHYSSKQYFWVGFITSIYIVFRFSPPHCTQPTCWYWDFIPFSEHCSSIKYFDLWFLVPFGMGIVRSRGLFKKEKNKNQKADLLDDKEEERYCDLFPSRRIQVDFVLTQLNDLGAERSFAFGITCPWGGGKTSFLNGVKDRIQKNGWSKNDFIQREHLAEDIAVKCEKLYQKSDRFDITEKDVIFVDYKPWFASGSKHVVAHFLDALQKSLSPYDGELAGSIAKYRKLLLSLNPGVFKSFVDGIVDFFSVHKDIEDRFKNVEKCIQRLNKKILVFMDDLDRLEANELVASLKIIRNTGSFKNVVFFVTYDKEYVLSQLATHFNFDKKDKKQGDRFLEKFFQLEVPLPQLYSSEVREYVKEFNDEDLSFKYKQTRYSSKLSEEIDFGHNHKETVGQLLLDSEQYDEIEKLYESIDLTLLNVSPRKWKMFINYSLLAHNILQGNCDYSQLFLMIVFKDEYPMEAYDIYRIMIEYEWNKVGGAVDNYEMKSSCPKVISALFKEKDFNQIGYFYNYLHYYNLSFPYSYVNDDEYNKIIKDPNELKKLRDDSREKSKMKYDGFCYRLRMEILENENRKWNFETTQAFLVVIEKELAFNKFPITKIVRDVYEITASDIVPIILDYPRKIDYEKLHLLLSHVSISSGLRLLLEAVSYIYSTYEESVYYYEKYGVYDDYYPFPPELDKEMIKYYKECFWKILRKRTDEVNGSFFLEFTNIFISKSSKLIQDIIDGFFDFSNIIFNKDLFLMYDFLLEREKIRSASDHNDLYSESEIYFEKLKFFKKKNPQFIQFVEEKRDKSENLSLKKRIQKVLDIYLNVIENKSTKRFTSN